MKLADGKDAAPAFVEVGNQIIQKSGASQSQNLIPIQGANNLLANVGQLLPSTIMLFMISYHNLLPITIKYHTTVQLLPIATKYLNNNTQYIPTKYHTTLYHTILCY